MKHYREYICFSHQSPAQARRKHVRVVYIAERRVTSGSAPFPARAEVEFGVRDSASPTCLIRHFALLFVNREHSTVELFPTTFCLVFWFCCIFI